jgi:ribosomal protein S18 acetylase RimI-like enzyme
VSSATLRDATVEDARAIAEVHVAAWRSAYRELLPDAVLEALSVEEREAMWREGLADPRPGWGCIVAEERDSIVGFVGYGPPEDREETGPVGEVYAIYLDPSAMGTGVGRELFAAATRRLRDQGYPRAFLWVLETNERARRFYERAGWTWDGTTSAHRFDRAELPIVRYAADL